MNLRSRFITYNNCIMQKDIINSSPFMEDFDIEEMLHYSLREQLESPIIEMKLEGNEDSEFNDDQFENRHMSQAYCWEDYIFDSEKILSDQVNIGSLNTDTNILSPQLFSRPIASEMSQSVLICRGIKKDKNSNAIKKIGRIILDNLKKYDLKSKPNQSLNSMMRVLSKHAKIGRFQVNKRDKFNTHHFKLLLNDADPQVVSHNLKVTQHILNKNLRSNVLSSHQITDQNKIVYLNTLKCTSLRCGNNKLAVRLQMHS